LIIFVPETLVQREH